MSIDQARKYYKQVVKQIHPDKNNHPLAKDAFQRVQSAVTLVLDKQKK